MPLFPYKNYLGFAVVALLTGTAASAQSIEDTISRCSAIASAEDRIVCLEAALRRPANEDTQEGTAVSKVVNDVAEEGDEVLNATAEEPLEPPVVEASNVLSEVVEELPDELPAAPAAVAVGMAGAMPEASNAVTIAAAPERLAAESATDELGAEQVDELAVPRKTRISATVVDFEMVGTGRLRFTLDNGQVWQQTGDDDAGINRKLRRLESVPAEMWRARSGGYRIYLVPIDRTVRVRRLK